MNSSVKAGNTNGPFQIIPVLEKRRQHAYVWMSTATALRTPANRPLLSLLQRQKTSCPIRLSPARQNHGGLTKPKRHVEHQIPPHCADVKFRVLGCLDPAPRSGRAVAVGGEREQHAHKSSPPHADVKTFHKAGLLMWVVHSQVDRDVVQHARYRYRPEDLSHLRKEK